MSYVAPAVFAAEQAEILEQVWFCAVRAADLEEQQHEGPNGRHGIAAPPFAVAPAAAHPGSCCSSPSGPPLLLLLLFPSSSFFFSGFPNLLKNRLVV